MTNKPILNGLIMVSGLSGLLMAALLSFIFAVTGEWRHIPAMLGVASLSAGVLFVLSLIAALLVYGNHMHLSYRLDGTGVESAVVDRRARMAAFALLAAGLLARRPGLAGGGLIAASGSRRHISWKSVAVARFDSRRRIISLANDWRTVAILFCTPSYYEAAAARVRIELARRPVPIRPATHPLLRLCLSSLLAAVACIPLFRLDALLDTGLFAPLCVLLFTLATIWLVPLLAWAIIGWIAWLFLLTALAMAIEHPSSLGQAPFLAYQVFSGDDWAELALAGAGAAYLVAFSVCVLRGRIRTGLQ